MLDTICGRVQLTYQSLSGAYAGRSYVQTLSACYTYVPPESSKTTFTGPVIGGIVGGATAAILVVLVALIVVRRRRRPVAPTPLPKSPVAGLPRPLTLKQSHEEAKYEEIVARRKSEGLYETPYSTVDDSLLKKKM